MESQEGVESVEVVAPAVNTQATAGEAGAGWLFVNSMKKKRDWLVGRLDGPQY
jgi:hypothetical protein